MGGIADYSGANVCEGVLGIGIGIALQLRTDRTLRIRTVPVGQRSLPVETRLPLDYLESGDALGSYAQVRDLCRASMGRAGNCYDNAAMGSFWATLKTELIDGRLCDTHAQARGALFDYIECFYNPRRLHGALGYQTPVKTENQLD